MTRCTQIADSFILFRCDTHEDRLHYVCVRHARMYYMLHIAIELITISSFSGDRNKSRRSTMLVLEMNVSITHYMLHKLISVSFIHVKDIKLCLSYMYDKLLTAATSITSSFPSGDRNNTRVCVTDMHVCMCNRYACMYSKLLTAATSITASFPSGDRHNSIRSTKSVLIFFADALLRISLAPFCDVSM